MNESEIEDALERGDYASIRELNPPPEPISNDRHAIAISIVLGVLMIVVGILVF